MVGLGAVGGRLREGVDSHRMGRHYAEMVRVVEGDDKEGRERQMEEMRQHNMAQMIKM